MPLIDKYALDELINRAESNPKRYARINIHTLESDPIQQMVICALKGSYIRPHYHKARREYFYFLDGIVAYLEWDLLESKIDFCDIHGPAGIGYSFLRSVERNKVHSLYIASQYAIFLEIADGPFTACSTIYPEWSPPMERQDEINEIMSLIEKNLNSEEIYLALTKSIKRPLSH